MLNKKSIFLEEIADIAEQVLNGDLSLSKSSQMIKDLKMNKSRNF